ncbi:MAG: hypothetical protein J3K34DRAFT_445975, partial [Monoraphidium minutum]
MGPFHVGYTAALIFRPLGSQRELRGSPPASAWRRPCWCLPSWGSCEQCGQLHCSCSTCACPARGPRRCGRAHGLHRCARRRARGCRRRARANRACNRGCPHCAPCARRPRTSRRALVRRAAPAATAAAAARATASVNIRNTVKNAVLGAGCIVRSKRLCAPLPQIFLNCSFILIECVKHFAHVKRADFELWLASKACLCQVKLSRNAVQNCMHKLVIRNFAAFIPNVPLKMRRWSAFISI